MDNSNFGITIFWHYFDILELVHKITITKKKNIKYNNKIENKQWKQYQKSGIYFCCSHIIKLKSKTLFHLIESIISIYFKIIMLHSNHVLPA